MSPGTSCSKRGKHPAVKLRALTIQSQQRRAGDFQASFPEDFFDTSEEIRHFGGDIGSWNFGVGNLNTWRQQTSNDSSAPGDLDLLAVAQEFLHRREAAAEIADRGLLHVKHSNTVWRFKTPFESGSSSDASIRMSEGFCFAAEDAVAKFVLRAGDCGLDL